MTELRSETPEARVELAMRRWVQNVVINLGFCPFAAAVLQIPGALHVEVVDGDSRQRLQWLLDKLHGMRQETAIETLLMVIPRGLSNFEEFLDFADLAEAVLEQHGFTGEFQLATFHPDYLFAHSPSDASNDKSEANGAEDAANYTNRSPYPALHILREQSISNVLETVAKPEEIPQRNIRHARSIGTEALARRLQRCFEATR